MHLFPQKTHLPLDWVTQILGLGIHFLWTVLGYEKNACLCDHVFYNAIT